MSEIEEINLEDIGNKAKKQQNQQRRPNKFIHKQRKFNQNKKRDWNKNKTKKRDNNLFEIDIYNFLAKNSISDLISDIKQRCGNVAKLEIIVNHIQEQETETRIILKAFFKDEQSADECYYQYNNADLDNQVLKTERRY